MLEKVVHSCLSVDPIFKIMVTQPNGKRRMKTAIEFGDALMSFLGKKSDRTTLEYSKFQDTLNRLIPHSG